MKEDKSFIVHFYNAVENNRLELIVAAAGVGENGHAAAESARISVKGEYPSVVQSLWVAYEHHTKLTPGPLPALMPRYIP